MQLKDITKFGSNDDLRDNLIEFSRRLKIVGSALYARADLEPGRRIVYRGIAESTAMQLELLARMIVEPIEISANICRIVFEINIRLLHCLLSKKNLNNYFAQFFTDEISICKSAKKLADKDIHKNNIQIMDATMSRLRTYLKTCGLPEKPGFQSTASMAKEVGRKEEYESMYGIYSKYVHASGWFVLSSRDRIDMPVYRYIMQVHTQLYASNTLKKLEDLGPER